MKGQLFAAFAALVLALGGAGVVAADVVPLGTDVISAGPGEVTVTVSNANDFAMCFEYRSDGDTSQASGEPNFNDNYSGLYPYFCLTSNSDTRAYSANAYVEIRSVFGAEQDLYFDWRRFDVGSASDGGGSIDLGELSNDNVSDQSAGQDQNQESIQEQVSSQHTTNTLNQSNVVSGQSRTNVSSGCEAMQHGSTEGTSSVDCGSSEHVDDGSSNGNVTQTSTASQIATIINEQAQSTSGGAQVNSGSNTNDQQINVSVHNTGGDVTSGAVVNVNDHSDDDAVDIDGTIDNSIDNDGLHGNNTTGSTGDGTSGAVYDYVSNEIETVLSDHLDDSFGGLIAN